MNPVDEFFAYVRSIDPDTPADDFISLVNERMEELGDVDLLAVSYYILNEYKRRRGH